MGPNKHAGGNRVERPYPRQMPATAAAFANHCHCHRRYRPGPAGRGVRLQPILQRFWQQIECGRVDQLSADDVPKSSRLRPLHARARRLELPRPRQRGQFDKVTLAQLANSTSRYQAASRTCQHLLPTPSVAQQRNEAAQALQVSRCMRSHNVSNFPDPDSSGRIPDPASFGIDQGSPQFEAANQAVGSTGPLTSPRIPPTTHTPGQRGHECGDNQAKVCAVRAGCQPLAGSTIIH